MRRIVCEDCGKPYDYDKEDFCPRCGAFNQPVKTWGTDPQGNVVRLDGVNEQNHAGSFVHREVHREKAVRRATGMDKRPQPRRTPGQGAEAPKSAPRRSFAMLGVKVIFWLIGMGMLLSFVSALIQAIA